MDNQSEKINLDANALRFLSGEIDQNQYLQKSVNKNVNQESNDQQRSNNFNNFFQKQNVNQQDHFQQKFEQQKEQFMQQKFQEDNQKPKQNIISIQNPQKAKQLNLDESFDNLGRYNNVKMETGNLKVERLFDEQMQQDIAAERNNTINLQHKFNQQQKRQVIYEDEMENEQIDVPDEYQGQAKQIKVNDDNKNEVSSIRTNQHVNKNPFNNRRVTNNNNNINNEDMVSREQYEQIEYKVQQLNAKIESLLSINQEMKVKLKIQDSQINEWQNYQKQNIDYYDDIEFYQNELKKHRKNYQEQEDKIDLLESSKYNEIMTLKIKLESFQNQDNDYEKIRFENQDFRQENMFLKNQIENLENKNEALERQHQMYLENNIQFNDENLIKKRTDRVQMEDIIIKKDSEIRDLNNKKHQYEILLIEKDRRINDFEQQILEQNEEIMRVKQQLFKAQEPLKIEEDQREERIDNQLGDVSNNVSNKRSQIQEKDNKSQHEDLGHTRKLMGALKQQKNY